MHRSRLGFAYVLAAAGLSGQTYVVLPSAGARPSPRIDPPLAYDPNSRRVYLFGGQDESNRNDLWAYALDSRSWTQLNPQGAIPAARFGHTLVFDAERRRLIVFGGQAATGFLSDTWAYDIADGQWQQLSRSGAGPTERYGHSAIYDAPRNRLIVSHGFTNAGRFDDTWAYDLKLEKWQNLSPTGERPLKRCLHHAVYDARNDQMLLYGGCSSGFGPCPQDDLWALDLKKLQWRDLTRSPRPTGRQWYGAAFDSTRGRLVVFGGSQGGGTLSDTWEYDTASLAWSPAALSGEAPAGRSRHEGVYVPDLAAALFFGGRTSQGATNELLAFAMPAKPRIASGGAGNAFSADRSAVAPGEVVSIFGEGLGPVAGVSSSFDAAGKLPVSLAGVSVSFNGVAAPLYFAQAGQVNAQAPYEIAGQAFADVAVSYNGLTSATERVLLAPSHPGVFPRLFNQDGTVNSPANPAAPRSVVVLFATGQGVTRPASQTGKVAAAPYPEPAEPVVLRIGGRPAELLFAGQAPGTAGVIQINARLPEGLTPGVLPVVLTIGAAASQPGVTLAFR